MPFYVRVPLHNPTLPIPSSTSFPDPKEEKEEDEEGLLLSGYDVIICGTNLVHSILSSALSLAGKSVLHCDGADVYGEGDATFHLKALLSWAGDRMKKQSETETEDEANATEQENEDELCLHPDGALRGLYVHSSSCFDTEKEIKIGTSVITPYGPGSIIDMSDTKISISLTSWTLITNTHPTVYVFCPPSILSLSSYLLSRNIQTIQHYHANQTLSQTRSFSLDLTPYLLFSSGKSIPYLLSSSVANYLEFKSILSLHVLQETSLHKVPCSKGEIFQSTSLTPLQKRKLMKLLQLALDFGVQHNKADQQHSIQSLNERELNEGRSLKRPQNKFVKEDVLERLLNDVDMTFGEYLNETHKLPEHLRDIVIHALAMCEEGSQIKEGLEGLYTHMESLGKYGDTAFLTPLYGSGELTQSFCRSSAVQGGIYLLRRRPLRILHHHSDNNSTLQVLLASDPDPTFGPSPSRDKCIPCKAAIISSSSILSSTQQKRKRILRRISIVTGLLQQEERSVVILPPNTVQNTNAIHCLILDESVCVSAKGYTVIQLSTILDACRFEDVKEEMLEQALSSLFKAQNRTINEIHHVSFSYPVDDVVPSQQNVPNGVYVTNHPPFSLTVEGAFEEAKRIFWDICPDGEFLKLSEEKKKKLRWGETQKEDNDDDEKEVLESALSLIKQERSVED